MPVWLNKIIGDAQNEFLSSELPEVVFARDFLRQRGVSESDLQPHGIGFAGSSFKVVECAEDFIPWSQQFLHNCIVFPLYNMLGEVIGMQIRIIGEQGHTRPYKQYYAYHRDIFPYFYGLPQALPHVYQTGYLIVVEGIFDYFAVRRITPNVMAVLTSGVPVACKRFFNRFTKRVVALLDMDLPGREGAERLARDSEGQNYSVTIPTYSEKDPSALLEKGKLSEIERIVSKTSNLLLR
jgi:DNA primase